MPYLAGKIRVVSPVCHSLKATLFVVVDYRWNPLGGIVITQHVFLVCCLFF